jgi:hypothetical protein
MSEIDCGTCAVGGKSLIFNQELYGKEITFSVIVRPGHTGTGIIQVHTWDRKPNSNLAGRKWYKNLPNQGGSFKVKPSSGDVIALSFFQVNPSQNNFWDCLCVSVNNLTNTIRIESF